MTGRPRIVQVYPMLHRAGEQHLDGEAELVTLTRPTIDCLVAEGAGAVAIVARRPIHIGGDVLDALPDVALLSATGSGADCFDVAAASARGIPVLHNPGVAPGPVAEYVIAAVVMLLKRIREADSFLRAGGDWEPKDRFRGREASGLTLGLVGFGHIARDVARRAKAALDMHVFAFSRSITDSECAALGVRRCANLATLLAEADVVSIHVPLTSSTRHLIGSAELAALRPGALLINTSRGGVVDEAALEAALRGGHLGGAAIDVFDPEPPTSDHPFFGLPNVVVTPHIAGLTDDAMRRLSEALAANLLEALRGERPPSLVDPAVWPPRRPVATWLEPR